MWFIGVILAAGFSISLLVLGSATYLEHDAAARAQARDMAALAVPLPMPRPKPPEVPRIQSVKADTAVEVVREPKQTWPQNGRGWNGRGWHAQKWNAQKWNAQKWHAQKSWSKPNRRSRQNTWHETW